VIHKLTISQHVRGGHPHPNAFDVYLAGKLICVSESPASVAAKVLLRDGTAKPWDTLSMHRLDTGIITRGKVGLLAGIGVRA
jgi:hypothetical protein